jgi:CheY-like chemotaxis protein
MDIQMPIMNGYEATEKIRLLERPDAKTIPIIAMTADAFSAAVEHSKVVGMNAYITKPLYLTTLKETLSPYLAKKEEKK